MRNSIWNTNPNNDLRDSVLIWLNKWVEVKDFRTVDLVCMSKIKWTDEFKNDFSKRKTSSMIESHDIHDYTEEVAFFVQNVNWELKWNDTSLKIPKNAKHFQGGPHHKSANNVKNTKSRFVSIFSKILWII